MLLLAQPGLRWVPRRPCPVIAHRPKAPAGRAPAPGTSVPVGLTHSPLEQTWELGGQSGPLYSKPAFPFGVGGLLSCPVAQLCPTLCDPMDCSTPFPVHHQLTELVSIESVILFNHLTLSRPLLFLPSIFPSIRVFSSESALPIRWPKYWSISFSISPSNEYSGLISFKTDWFDLLAIQGTLKSLLQHHGSKASILQHSAFFTVQLSHPFMTTGKTIALTRRTFVGKVVSLLFNMLSRFVTAVLPRSKCLLISWLQSPSAVILEPKKIKSVTVSSSV